jgi:hypothetical protein
MQASEVIFANLCVSVDVPSSVAKFWSIGEPIKKEIEKVQTLSVAVASESQM